VPPRVQTEQRWSRSSNAKRAAAIHQQPLGQKSERTVDELLLRECCCCSDCRTKWSALRAWSMNIAKRRGMARARVAPSRKLAVILHRIWVEGSKFRWGKQAAASAAVG
jgi:hypothetical protein